MATMSVHCMTIYAYLHTITQKMTVIGTFVLKNNVIVQPQSKPLLFSGSLCVHIS